MRLIGVAVILALSLALAPGGAEEGRSGWTNWSLTWLTSGSTSSSLRDRPRPGLPSAPMPTTPIVMMVVPDPVGEGLVASLARPGGNVTGLSTLAPELYAKRLELMKEAIPAVTRLGCSQTRRLPIRQPLRERSRPRPEHWACKSTAWLCAILRTWTERSSRSPGSVSRPCSS